MIIAGGLWALMQWIERFGGFQTTGMDVGSMHQDSPMYENSPFRIVASVLEGEKKWS